MKHYAILFNRKTGTAIKIIEQPYGDALLKIVALNNTKSSQDCIIFNDNGIVTAYFKGNKKDKPTMCEDMLGKSIEEFCFMPTMCEDMLGKSIEEFGLSIKEIM